MNQLFLKIKLKKYSILFAFLSLSLSLFANDSIPKSIFSEQLKKADAYLVHSYKDVTYERSWGQYKRYTSIDTKLVVNNNAGVDKFAYLSLTEYLSNKLTKINVTALKADGTVVELDSSLVFKKKSNEKWFGEINYPIPGVEPGDTIHTSYVYREYLKKHELMDFVNLYSEVPSLNTEYTVKSKPNLLVRYKRYNNFPEPTIISNDTLIYCVFKMQKIKSLSENQNMCIPCELPHLYYSLEKEGEEQRTWKDVYNEEFNVITQPILFDYEKSSYYRKWKKKVIGNAKDSSKHYKFKLLHKDVYNNIQMEDARKNELIKSNGYFLKEKRFNSLNIRRLYRQILEDLGIEYSAVFARSKQAGKIDPYYIRKGEFDHIFFAYEDDKKTINLLYPHDTYYKYQINEIPTSLYNTEAVIAKPYLKDKIKKSDKFINRNFKLAKVDSVTVNIIKLPGTSANRNYLRQVYYSKINLKDPNILFKSRFSIAGGMSTDLRSFFGFVNQNQEVNDFYDALAKFEGSENSIKIDTVMKTNLNSAPPFKYSVTTSGTLTNGINYLNDNLISINLHDLIQHSLVESELDSTDLNYYLNYGYVDDYMYIMDFPSEIEVLDLNNSQVNYKNTIGEYSFNIKVNQNNKLNVHSNYKILKDIILKDEYKYLKKMNELVQEAKNKRLLIKLKN